MAIRFAIPAIAMMTLTAPVFADSKAYDWPAIMPGNIIDLIGRENIPQSIMSKSAAFEGNCDDMQDDEGKLFYPAIKFFETATARSFAVLACSSIHNEITNIFENTSEGIIGHSFVSTYGSGFFVMDTLENVGIIDPKSGELVSFEREGACGDGNQDFMRYYRLSDTKYFLYKIEMRPCMGGAWKTVLELRN